MRNFAKRALWGVAIAGGITLLGATAANAAETDGEDSILSGTQSVIPVSIPVDITGNAISLLGTSAADAPASVPADGDTAPAPETSGTDGAASGTQAVVTVNVPVTVQNTGVSVLGSSDADAHVDAPASSEPAAPLAATPVTTSGADSLLGGTQALLDVNVPVTVTDNAISALGTSEVAAPEGSTAPAASTPASTPDATTNGTDGTASGTQVVAPVAAPVTVGDNAIAILGESTVSGGDATDATAAPANGTTATTPTTNGTDGTASGIQVAAPITTPITVGGNAISAVGTSTVNGGAADLPMTGDTGGTEGGGTEGGGTDGVLTDGVDAILGGSQVALPISAPITIGGNAVGVLGDSTIDASPVVPAVAEPNPGTDPGTNPETNPGTNPGNEPGENPGTNPGATPGTTPGATPGTTPGTTGTTPETIPGTTPATTGSAVPMPSGQGSNIVAAADGGMLAMTGASTPAGAALLAAMLLLIGAGLLRRHVTA